MPSSIRSKLNSMVLFVAFLMPKDPSAPIQAGNSDKPAYVLRCGTYCLLYADNFILHHVRALVADEEQVRRRDDYTAYYQRHKKFNQSES